MNDQFGLPFGCRFPRPRIFQLSARDLLFRFRHEISQKGNGHSRGPAGQCLNRCQEPDENEPILSPRVPPGIILCQRVMSARDRIGDLLFRPALQGSILSGRALGDVYKDLRNRTLLMMFQRYLDENKTES